MDFSTISQTLTTNLTDLALKVIGALVLWIIGGWLIRLVVKLTEKAMGSQKIDKTIIGYVGSTMSITLKILLVIGILGFFGIQTTTFAALLAAIGLAIGLAWGNLLANFAAGAFLVVLRPFKAGDEISAGGVTGRVEEVGIFTTTINTDDNVKTFVGNNKIFSDNIQNFSANPYRRVKCSAQLDHSTDHNLAIRLLEERVSQIPNVMKDPKPVIGIGSFSPMGPVLAVMPFCHHDHFDDVTADTNRVIRETFSEAGFDTPKQHYVMKQ